MTVVAAIAGALLAAPTATATPDCTNTGPLTTQCETPGHAQIVTSPPVMNNNSYPYGGFVVGFPW
ncbi:MAG: hypothetical protein ABW137_26260 [Mycobacterium sp.]